MNYAKKIQLNYSNNILILVITIFLIFPLFIIHNSLFAFAAASPLTAIGTSPDAIAIRVMPNSDHYSPLVWYKKNIKLQGSPQNLLVDGYEAVRDGRTVYVNAANISGNNFYTNIYIISYNQDAEASTIDIFGQILAHWKFNTNPGINNNQKQKIIRDVKRLANLYEMNLALANYKKDNFPRLKSGSYITGASVSTWPSWQATLGAELGITMPLDPINKLGSCPAGYDEKTCWNQTDKKFYFNFNITAGDNKSISHSPVYWYKDGVFYAGLETNYNILLTVPNISFNVAAP
jgi:hypothetical protein